MNHLCVFMYVMGILTCRTPVLPPPRPQMRCSLPSATTNRPRLDDALVPADRRPARHELRHRAGYGRRRHNAVITAAVRVAPFPLTIACPAPPAARRRQEPLGGDAGCGCVLGCAARRGARRAEGKEGGGERLRRRLERTGRVGRRRGCEGRICGRVAGCRRLRLVLVLVLPVVIEHVWSRDE